MSPLGATILRVMLGAVYVAHGYYIFEILTTDALTVMINRRLGLPIGDYVTMYILLAHWVGGIMLILGIFTRWVAMANVPVMIGALVLFHFDQGFFLHGVVIDAARGKADVAGYEYALVLMAATIAQVFLGTGSLGLTKD